MRILQVVPYVSADGAFGGPVSVAVAQSAALAQLGHDVRIVAAWDGRAELAVPGVRVRLAKVRRPLPVTRFATQWSRAAGREIRAGVARADIVHVHAGPQLMAAAAMRAARAAGVPTVVQPHGQIRPDAPALSRAFRTVFLSGGLSSASLVLALTDRERRDLAALGVPDERLERITNGIELAGHDVPRVESSPPEVLFMARLHPRKRAATFVEAARLMLDAGVVAEFAIVGPDGGDLGAVEAAIAASGHARRIRVQGPVSFAEARPRLARAAVYVLPSVGEVVPMSVLEAAAVRTPVVMTAASGLAAPFAAARAAVVVEGQPADIAEAVADLLADPEAASAMASRARFLVESDYSATAMAEQLEHKYARLVAG